MTDEQIQFILGHHWENRRPASIANRVRLKFKIRCKISDVLDTIKEYTLRHHGEPVKREDWPCK